MPAGLPLDNVDLSVAVRSVVVAFTLLQAPKILPMDKIFLSGFDGQRFAAFDDEVRVIGFLRAECPFGRSVFSVLTVFEHGTVVGVVFQWL